MKTFLLICLHLIGINSIGAASTLMVDFNSNQDSGGDSSGAPPESSTAAHNQSGWSSYHANHELIPEFTTATYGAITVTPNWTNTTDARVRQSIDRSSSFDNNWNNSSNDLDLVTDFIGIDTRTGNGGNGNWDGTNGTPTYMTLTISGLSASQYSWTSFHHDTEHVHGNFAVWVSLDSGTNFTALADGYMSDSTSAGNPDSATGGFPGPQSGPDANSLLSTYNTVFTANGTDDIVFRFAPYSNSAVHRQIWGMNGFIINQIPEPSTGLLGLVALSIFLFWRGR